MAKAPILFRYPRQPDAPRRLFCFPYAGGGAPAFRPWVEHLPSVYEVWAVVPPGRGTRLRDTPVGDALALAEETAGAMAALPSRPFVFFGHSMGAIVAFETARQLRRMGLPLPGHLIMSGYNAVHLPDPRQPVRDLPDGAFLDAVRSYGGMPEEILDYPELLDIVLPTLRADFAVCETYVYTPEPPFPCPITVFAGREDATTTQERLAPWAEQTTGGYRLCLFPGGHFFIHTEEEAFLAALHRSLEQPLP